jgi:RNA polymerase sigma factor (sigma-70 family)
MNITAITKFKQGDIYRALQELGWNQSDLARATGLSVSRIGDYINMKRRPSQEQAEKIENAFGKAGVYIDIASIWPESFEGFKKRPVIEETRDIEPSALLGGLHEPSFITEDKQEALRLIDDALSSISTRERRVIEAKVFKGKTYAEIGRAEGVSPSRAMSIYVFALKKLRHPSRIKNMREALLALSPPSESIDIVSGGRGKGYHAKTINRLGSETTD